MSPLGHVTVLSDSTLAKLNPPSWTPTVLACLAVILVGVVLIVGIRDCWE